MNTMNMPGFTGEASFYKTTQSYRGSGNRPPGAAGPTVVAPQLGCCEQLVFRRAMGYAPPAAV